MATKPVSASTKPVSTRAPVPRTTARAEPRVIAKTGQKAPDDRDSTTLVRLGTLIWVLGSERLERGVRSDEAKQELTDGLVNALRSDSRVSDVSAPELSMPFTYASKFFPDGQGASTFALLTGSDFFTGFRLSTPVLFSLRIPAKNQPKHHGHDDVPSDVYWAAWDGLTVWISWKQETTHTPMSGGHVVQQVLSDALAVLGDRLYTQACSPGCQNVFLHTTLLLEQSNDAEGAVVVSRGNGPFQLKASVLMLNPPWEALTWLHLNLTGAASDFAEMKNTGRRLRDLEEAARSELTHLSAHYYEHSRVSTLPFRQSLALRWQSRGWRREARQLLAGLWLAMAQISTLRSQWAERQREFSGSVGDDGHGLIFLADQEADSFAIGSLDVGPMERTVEQIAARLDNRALVTATLAGVVGGAAAGAAAALLGG